MTTYSMRVKHGYAIWMGALARIDLISGEDKYLTFVCATDVTIHRTPINKAVTIFQNQAGKLLKPTYLTDLNLEESKRQEEITQILDGMVKHEITLKCNEFKLSNFEIVIDGLGWISVQGKGFVSFILHIPEGIKFHIREMPE